MQFEERLQLRGGNPRIVLARAKDESDHDSIDKALGRSSWQMLSAVMNPQSGITDGFSHQLCMIDVTDWRSGTTAIIQMSLLLPCRLSRFRQSSMC